MDTLFAIGFLVVGIAVVIFKVRGFIRAQRSANPASTYGLPPGDAARYSWRADFDVQISNAEQAGAVASGLLMGGIRIMRPRFVDFTITNQGYLAITVEADEVKRALYTPQDGLQFQWLGPGEKYVQGGPSQRLRVITQDNTVLQVLIHYTAPPLLTQWAQGGGA